MRTVLHRAACIASSLALGVSGAFAQTTQWSWEQSGASNQNNVTTTGGTFSGTSNATGSNVQLNRSLSTQPPTVVKAQASASPYTITTSLPGVVDFRATVTDGRTSVPRATATTYTYSVTNAGSTARTALVQTQIMASAGYTAPASVASISCGATASCTVLDANTVQVTIPAGATVTLTRAATMANASSWVMSSVSVTSANGMTDLTPADNLALDSQSVT